MLGETIEKLADNKIVAEIVFTLNEKSEIVIVSVKSQNQRIDSFVKSKLNYKKVHLKTINEDKIYHMPLTIVNG